MSSLLKYTRVISKQEDARIIDSNERMAAKLAELAAVSNYITKEDDDNEFVRGINAEQVELLLEDETVPEPASDEILEEAKEEAARILERANAEKVFLFEESKKSGYQIGYQDGYQKALMEFEQKKIAIEQEKKVVIADYNQRLEEMEPVLVDTLLDIFETVLSVDLSERRLMILQLLRNNLSQIERSKDYIIRVSKEDYEALSANQEEIRQLLPEDAQVSVVEDLTLKIHQCMVETDRGIFDCSLDTQMESLMKTLRIISQT